MFTLSVFSICWVNCRLKIEKLKKITKKCHSFIVYARSFIVVHHSKSMQSNLERTTFLSNILHECDELG